MTREGNEEVTLDKYTGKAMSRGMRAMSTVSCMPLKTMRDAWE
jgi:hypothetical protein